ncbi:MAG: tRNA-intron lyase [Promethearchaeota archaeon]|jgi:tRNA-intron endonuclease
MTNDNSLEISDNKKNDSPPEVIGLLIESLIRVYGENKFYYYDLGYYGNKTDNYLELEYEEALLLAERGRIEIHYSETPSSTEEYEITENYIQSLPVLDITNLTKKITKETQNFWGRYLVYKDLRSRGYVVRPGYGPSAPYRRYPRGAKAEKAQSNALVFPFVEGTKMELFELEQLEELSHSNRKALILGIVDRSGDVTYYKASEFELNENKEHYEWHDEITLQSEQMDNDNDKSDTEDTLEESSNP